MKDMNNVAEQIFIAGVCRVKPDLLIRSVMSLSGNILQIEKDTWDIGNFLHIYVLAIGKAGALMAKEAEAILGSHLTSGLAIVKYGHGCHLDKIRLFEAGHPVPDEQSVKAAEELQTIAKMAGEQDLVICLISGGASALVTDFPAGSSLDEVATVNEQLVKCGADIKEINAVRKHLSKIKGGGLAKIIYPATTISLILSDVIGDPLDVIASGPTSADTTTFEDAWHTIENYGLASVLPISIRQHLEAGCMGLIQETPKPGNAVFFKVKNSIIGSNRLALEAAAMEAKKNGYDAFVITDMLSGDYVEAAEFIIKKIKKFYRQPKQKPWCLLFGGEPTVKVTANGLGGRNQHLALYCAIQIAENFSEITMLAAGTDGTDGPTEVAGAIIDTFTAAGNASSIASEYLRNNDSYHFFSKYGGHVITGSTHTNVMDMIVVLSGSIE